MRLLLDECVPKRLRREMASHEVRTVPEMGWAGITNGELLRLAESGFDVFVTTDQSLKYQQSITGMDISVVVLIASRNKLDFLLPLVPKLLRVIVDINMGELIELER